MGSEWTTIGAISEVFDGPHATPTKIEEGPYFLSISSLEVGKLDLEKSAHISDEQFEKWTRRVTPKEGDLLFSYETRLGEAALMPGGIKACLGRRMGLLRIDRTKVDPRYLLFAYLGPQFQQEIRTRTNYGATVERIALKELPDFPIQLPPLPEQKAIAHILGTLDDKIELNRRMNATLEGMAQALFKSWFVDFDPVIDNALAAGNPIPDELAPRADVRSKILEQNQNDECLVMNDEFNGSSIHNSSLKTHHSAQTLFPAAFQFTEELGWIPEGWNAVRFDELVSAKQGRYLAKTDMAETADSVFKYPVWGGNGILGFSSSYAYEEPITLMTCRGSNCGLIKFTESSAWISNNSFACPTKYGSQYFLYLYFRNENFEECVSGSAQPQITYTALKNKVMKFPISEPICELFSNLVQSYKDRQAQNGSQNKTLTKLRDTLLPKLISGELRIENAQRIAALETKEILS